MYTENTAVLKYSPNTIPHKQGMGYAPNQAVRIPEDAEMVKIRFNKTFSDDRGHSGYWSVAFPGDSGYDNMKVRPITLSRDVVEICLPHGSNNAKRGPDPLRFKHICDIISHG